MRNPATDPLARVKALRIRQKKEWGEILSGWETRNRYQIESPDGHQWFAGEVDGGLGAMLLRVFLKSKRPFSMEVRAGDGTLALRLVRPWRWLFSRLEILSPSGATIGAIQQRFRFFARHYDVLGPDGSLWATLEGPFFRPWTFWVRHQGRDLGQIQKKWSGIGREFFTDSDSFGVEFFADAVDLALRQLVLGATFLIDFVHFENRR
ncbi:MAG: phospholipid scramblase-related protein [Myxococcaceae bacterium]